jgi:ABC-type lipoprotein export system ATPase subunit
VGEILRFENVWKWAGNPRIEIVRGLSLSVKSGEFVAIMGPSGSGKSTFLNMAGLLDKPSQGQIFLGSEDVSQLSEDERATLRAQHLGFVFQNFNLLPYYTALENVALPLGYAGTRDKGRCAALLEQMGLGHRLHALPTTMSGGERQRIALARALINEPKIILADEPTGALDSKTGAQVMDFLSGLKRQGITLLVVTHDPTVAQRAERVLQMSDGRLV